MSGDDVLDGTRWVARVRAARERIRGLALSTPLVPSFDLTRYVEREVWLKYEQVQPTGAFKVRGAANFLREHREAAGAVTYSTGNHGLAVAYVARALGMTATVCVSRHVPTVKVSALRQLRAEVRVCGESQDAAGEAARRLARQVGQVLVEPFDDPAIIAGQGTIAAEILESLPAPGTVVVPLSGGGLLAGVAVYLKMMRPQARVVGVSMERAPVMYHSLLNGHAVTLPEQQTLADSLQGGIGLGNRYTLAMIRQWADDTVLVSEAEIAEAMGYLAVTAGQLVEGAAAVGVAALLHRRVRLAPGPVVVLITGRTVEAETIVDLTRQYLERNR
ncbi:MAG: pyridoxal-phosphate dependent enzyme [Thermaerobacter sp.]|nr:pyridoxal-phosphate dependent enzyme [Thermaerobacter sp.]